MSDRTAIPTLSQWLGGRDRLAELTRGFYTKVPADPILGPVFANMDPGHAAHVADFIDEVFGGPAAYSDAGGSHAGMIGQHLERALTETQRRRWFDLMLETADEAGLPDDPEFRAAFVGYLEWGTRLAVINSAPGVADPAPAMPMPVWGWGPPGGPWKG
ncbi:globin [Brevundimonas sp. LM2]|nr:group II truncated hemoglobin [Brevundimonas sp. LM2]AQR61645.1 globin [Brevundimonas sp. LM2]